MILIQNGLIYDTNGAGVDMVLEWQIEHKGIVFKRRLYKTPNGRWFILKPSSVDTIEPLTEMEAFDVVATGGGDRRDELFEKHFPGWKLVSA